MKKVIVTILLPTILLLSRQAAGQAAPGSLDDQLIQAARNGDTTAVQQLLDKGANIEAKNSKGSTALYIAAANGKTDAVKLLLSNRANIEAQDYTGNTVLIAAAYWGEDAVVKLLLDKGANVEAKTHVGATALIQASINGQSEVVKLLLEKGANIEDKTKYGDTALILAAYNGKPEVVKLLLDRGANVDVEGKYGATALIQASFNGRPEVVRLLLDKGANTEIKDKSGHTALRWTIDKCDRIRPPMDEDICFDEKFIENTEVVHLLEQAVSRNPQNSFEESLSSFNNTSWDDDRRLKVVRAAASLPALPPIPEEARQAALQASALMKALMKQSSDPKDLALPIELLKKALVIAPWWGNAYYNLSRAWELDGQYDEAVKQMGYYLELKPSEADAAEARAHIAVIQAEKKAAEGKEQENEVLLAVKYVSGGITRLRFRDAPGWWKHAVNTLYAYAVPEESPFYINVFRMPNGHFLAIFLIAQSNKGSYAGDRLGVIDITDQTCLQFNDFAFGEQNSVTTCGTRYYVNISNQPNATVTVTYPATGASVAVPVALLYRGRALLGSNNWDACRDDGTVHQGGARAMVLHFDCSVVKAAEDPTVNAAGLTPTTVIPE